MNNNNGAKRQARSSWWSSSNTGKNWLGKVREQFARKASAATAPGTGFGVRQDSNKAN